MPAATVVQMGDPPRYRCDGCGNLTRFDVTTSQTTRAFHHYTVGGELEVEEATVLSHHVDEVVCRWCGHGRRIVELTDGQSGGADEAAESGCTGADQKRDESGAASRIS